MYFNEVQESRKAFLLVTAGPGLTNTTTAIAGAWLESRELLVLGGQVKTSDLGTAGLRQKGIQEVNGVEIVEPITKVSQRLNEPIGEAEFKGLVSTGFMGRKGPVFLELPLDVQGGELDDSRNPDPLVETKPTIENHENWNILAKISSSSQRPILLIGAGVDRNKLNKLLPEFEALNIPIMTTWNGADRVNGAYSNYFGRPNTWGQRYSNILLQQSDLVLAVGTRLGLQQTGFNWTEFAPIGKVVQVDIDRLELEKGNPVTDLVFNLDANVFLEEILNRELLAKVSKEWTDFCLEVKSLLPVVETNQTAAGYISPYVFWNMAPSYFPDDSVIIPSSSGATFTTAYQSIELKGSQKLLSDKSLASMGYGLPGAIGAALAEPEKIILLGEGDGGFAQNLQELGTVSLNNLNIKMFVFDNGGYASIKMTQRNYFNGAWIGCDSSTGVGLPNLKMLAETYGIQYLELDSESLFGPALMEEILAPGPVLIRVPIDPEQTFFPKINSRINEFGSMESNPLHLMYPELTPEVSIKVFRYLKGS